MADRGISYDDAGVNLDAARVLSEGIRDLVHGGTTGFAGTLPMPPMRDGVLVACTDGVGTKVLLARQMGDVSGLGQDLVAMSVNDLVCTGARPLFFLDYLAVGKLDPDEAKVIIGAVREACLDSGCVLLGGETAEMPGLYAEGHFDMAGFAVGVVERADMLGPEKVQAGDVIVGIESSGIHSNGYSLVRALMDAGAAVPDPSLLAPTRLYPADVKALQASGVELHAAAHITGGGLPENLPRAFPDGLRPVLKKGSWPQAPAIAHVLAGGAVDESSAWDTFNMGLGMCLVMPAAAADRALAIVGGSHIVGRVEAGPAGLAWEG
ncbi:MAG: phosphoribosylformylglycinamidine cyclo-ligase [Actinobacteria bacterium]|nr:phosphoribosylformylglycinamidine cyclo-ligase [Actinomycetota bacterium]